MSKWSVEGRDTRAALLVAITILGSLVATASVHPAEAGILGLNWTFKGDSQASSVRPYEPIGPWIDGIEVPQFLVNQNNEWAALKSGSIDLYDWPMTSQQIAEYNSNICVPAPNLPANTCVDGTGSHLGFDNIQNQIATVPVNAFGKDEVDMQNALFPSNTPQFRQAVAFATDKQAFIANILGSFGATNYGIVGCPALCNPNGFWVDPNLVEGTTPCFAVAGNALPYTAGGNCNQPTTGTPAGGIYPNVAQARADAANALLDAAGMPVATSGSYTGFRVDETATCASQTIAIVPASIVTKNDCGLPIKPVFYVRLDDPHRTGLGEQLRNVLENQLHIDMNLGAQACTFPIGAGYCNYQEVLRHAVIGPVFLNFQYNMYTGGWLLSRDPTYIDDLYDSNFIRAGNTNYPNYNSAAFNGFARGLRAATSLSGALTSAYSAEHAFNDSMPIVDVWTDTAPLAYRIFHSDSDPTLNGLRWEGIQNQVGVGPYGTWTFLNTHLVGSPFHDPNHPVFIKWGWKTDVLDNPNPIDSFPRDMSGDSLAYSLTYDRLNNLELDNPGFTGDMPWMVSVPSVTNVASGATFPNGEVCTPDFPAFACSVLSYQMRPDLSFAASLDGSIPAIPVTPADVQFTILDGRDSPTSFITSAYIHVKDVVVTGALSFDVYEKNAAVWDRHDIGGTVPISFQHWVTERGFTFSDSGGVATFSPGFPDFQVNTLSSTNGAQKQGPPVGVDLGSYAFVYDSQLSFQIGGVASPDGPVLYRTRQTPGLSLPLPYNSPSPNDGYFTAPHDVVQSNFSGALSCLGTGTISCTGSFSSPTVGISYSGSITFSFDTSTLRSSVTGSINGPYLFSGAFSGTNSTSSPPQPNTPEVCSVKGLSNTITVTACVFPVSSTSTSFSGMVIVGLGGWYKFHEAGNVNWWCTALSQQPCSPGIAPEVITEGQTGPGFPDTTINFFDLVALAIHFGEVDGNASNPCANIAGGCPYGHAPWDLNGPAGVPDGRVNIFDLVRVATHLNQAFMGGFFISSGSVHYPCDMPCWVNEVIPGT